jgi:cathepsin L
MKFLSLVIICALAALASSASLESFEEKSWSEFKALHGKNYRNEQEEHFRRAVWQKNARFIQQHNAQYALGKKSFTVAMNKFGDLTGQEFSGRNGFNKTRTMQRSKEAQLYAMSNAMIPDSVDWRTQGYVTPVKDQGQCGSCWAFSAIATLEGQHKKQSGTLVSLSEQNLVDCSGSFGNMGCNGGLMDQAFQYCKANKGIDTEDSYPYTAQDGDCKFNPAFIGATCTGFVDLPAGDENALTNAVATIGPISGAIDASQTSFQFYQSGIYSDPDCSSQNLDHGTNIIGYGTLGAGQDFYILKNMWGTAWGEQGYMRMARNQNNMCGIATMASYVLI